LSPQNVNSRTNAACIDATALPESKGYALKTEGNVLVYEDGGADFPSTFAQKCARTIVQTTKIRTLNPSHCSFAPQSHFKVMATPLLVKLAELNSVPQLGSHRFLRYSDACELITELRDC